MSKGWATMSKYRLKITIFEALWIDRVSMPPKFQVEGDVPHQSCQKTRCNSLSCGVRMSAELSFVFVTIHACDGRTDGRHRVQKDRVACMQRGNNWYCYLSVALCLAFTSPSFPFPFLLPFPLSTPPINPLFPSCLPSLVGHKAACLTARWSGWALGGAGCQMHFGAFYFKISAFGEGSGSHSLFGSRSLLKKHRERQIPNHHSIFGGDKVIGIPPAQTFKGTYTPCPEWIDARVCSDHDRMSV